MLEKTLRKFYHFESIMGTLGLHFILMVPFRYYFDIK